MRTVMGRARRIEEGGGGGTKMTKISPYHRIWIIHFVYYVKLIKRIKFKNSLLMIIYEAILSFSTQNGSSATFEVL